MQLMIIIKINKKKSKRVLATFFEVLYNLKYFINLINLHFYFVKYKISY